jgi:hypothetical protein
MRDYARLQRCLLSDLNPQEHILTSDMTLEAANRLWMWNSVLKKNQDKISPDADNACLKLFKESNERCKNHQLIPQTVQEEQVIGEVINQWHDLCFSGPEQNFGLSDIFDRCGLGPGANLECDSYNFYTKLFDSPLTGTSERLYRYYRYAISSNPTWLNAEKLREEKFGTKIVVGNRLSFVPKTSDVSRSICTEPVLNMFLQKGIGSLLELMLRKRFKIDLSRQPEYNRDMARLGSIDGGFATIDLSSASDSIALSLVEKLIPDPLLDLIKLSRSPVVVYPDGSSERLYMVSSMGNGFTFPLETLLFSTIVIACYRILGIAPKMRHDRPLNFAVFGDDIIVRKDAYYFVCRMLEVFGFVVNDQKSFNAGNFRESCGQDFFRGHDIRGVYLKTLHTSADVYSAINRIVRWSARTGILMPQTVDLLKSWVKFLPIPFQAGDSEGVKVPYVPSSARYIERYQAYSYEYLGRLDNSLRVPDGPEKRIRYFSKGRRLMTFNPDGIIVTLVGGYIRDGRILLRHEVYRPKVRRRITSSWCEYTAGSFSLGTEWVFCAELYGLSV